MVKCPHLIKQLNNNFFIGDSALHDAIGKENSEVVELLCNVPSLDLTIRNKRGFNCLHHASLKGNVVSFTQQINFYG